jgi:hypothetical protein
VSESDLVEQQQRLPCEAEAVHADLRLDEHLDAVGDPIRVRSSALAGVSGDHGFLDVARWLS